MNRNADGRSPALLAHDHAGSRGTTVVFLHGVFMDRRLWDDIVIPDVQRLVADMPGHGRSPRMLGATLDDHVSAVAALLDHHEVDRPVIVGHSWGGMVALRLAQRRPLRGLVLTNTPVRRTTGRSRFGFRAQRLMLGLGLPAATYGRLAAGSLIGEKTRKRRPDLLDAAGSRAKRIGRAGIRDTLRSVLLEPGDAFDLLTELQPPWTFVAGRDDYVIANGDDERIRSVGTLHLVDGGHTTPLESPDELTRIIIDFLQENP